MVNGFNKDKLALAGIQDNSFENAYQAKAKEQLQTQQAASALAELIKGKSLDLSNKNAEVDHLDRVQQTRRDKDLGRAQDYVESNEQAGRKSNVKIGDVSISQADAQPNLVGALRQQQYDQKNANDYSKQVQKGNGFDSALEEIDRLSNRDGKGGVISNPSAQLRSTGKVQSALPSATMGLASLLGSVLPGKAGEAMGLPDDDSIAERKALERLKIEYQQAKSGMRVTPEARAQESAALGFMASSDPALVAKGVRSLAQLRKSSLNTIKGGISPAGRQIFEDQSGDPSERYNNIYDDAPKAPAAAGAGPAPTAPSPAGGAQTKTVGGRTYTKNPQSGLWE